MASRASARQRAAFLLDAATSAHAKRHTEDARHEIIMACAGSARRIIFAAAAAAPPRHHAGFSITRSRLELLRASSIISLFFATVYYALLCHARVDSLLKSTGRRQGRIARQSAACVDGDDASTALPRHHLSNARQHDVDVQDDIAAAHVFTPMSHARAQRVIYEPRHYTSPAAERER